MFGKVTKTEWCLLGLTGIFLCGLLALSQHDRREMEDGGWLAQVLADQGHLLPGEGAVLAAAQEAFMPDVRPLDLNTATAEELMALPGIGEELSRRILEYRETHGPFAAVEELMEVSGIGEAKLAALEGRVTVNGE